MSLIRISPDKIKIYILNKMNIFLKLLYILIINLIYNHLNKFKITIIVVIEGFIL